MTEPKIWKAGIADEAWKVLVCGRELHLVQELETRLSYLLTEAGSDTAKGLAQIRQMTGAQIIDALAAHKETSRKSIENALRRPQVAD